MLKVDVFTESEKEELASIWKRHEKVLEKLRNAMLYTATVEYVESKREKEIVENMSGYFTDILKGFYGERSEKTQNI